VPLPTPHPVTNYLLWVFIALLVFVVVWDATVIALRLPDATVSYSLYFWAQRYPLLYLLLGVLIGHLIVPLVVLGANGNPH
jgi:hypothetical protein